MKALCDFKARARLGLWARVYKDAVRLGDVWKQFAPEASSTRVRQGSIRAFHTRYIDNIALFDHVILNYAEGRPQDMVRQALSIIRRYSKYAKRPVARPPVFVICAASGMGKGTSMELVNLIGGKTVRIVTKVAGRASKANDKSDGMIALGVGAEFPKEFNVRWTFHKNIPYAISGEDVKRGMEEGIAQVFTSNMGQIEKLRTEFGDNVSFESICIGQQHAKKWKLFRTNITKTTRSKRKSDSERLMRFMKNTSEGLLNLIMSC